MAPGKCGYGTIRRTEGRWARAMVEGSRVDRELELLLRGARLVLFALAVFLLFAVGLWVRGPRGPHPYGDGACRVTRYVGECIIP